MILEKTWLQWQLLFVSRLQIKTVHLVLGFAHEEILAKNSFLRLHQTIDWNGLKVHCILNHNPQDGSFSSLFTAVNQIQGTSILYFPIDVPCPKSHLYQKIVDENSSDYEVLKCCYQNQGGHPLLLKEAFLERIRTSDPKKTQLNWLMRNLDFEKIKRLESNSPDVLLNLNYPKDLLEYVNNDTERFVDKA